MGAVARSRRSAGIVAASAILAASVILSGLLGSCGTSRGQPPSSGGAPGQSGATTSSASSGGASVAGAGAPVSWSPCSGAAGPSGFQCAKVAVPRDPASSQGPTLSLALDRRPASGTDSGVLLVNPGGPGVSGVDFLPEIVKLLPSSILDHFDVIGFDPPGVARSAPIDCGTTSQMLDFINVNPAPTTPGGLASLLSADRAFAAACQARSGAELGYVSTADAAMDMDYIRKALGVATISYLGFSYGTFLGATYANLFPRHVRAMVLDGAINPALGVLASLDYQSTAFEGDLNSMFASCQANAHCPWKAGADPLKVFEALVAAVTSKPLAVSGSAQAFGPAQLLYATAAGLYSQSTWPTLEAGLAEVASGNPSILHALFDSYIGLSAGRLGNELEAETAVNCLDAPAPSVQAVEAAAPAARAAAPVFGVMNLYSELVCSVWPTPATSKPANLPAVGAPPIVVVGTTGDPATPYSEAVALASELRSGVLVTRVGEGHTAYAYSSCVRSYVDNYLLNLKVPPAGLRCPSN